MGRFVGRCSNRSLQLGWSNHRQVTLTSHELIRASKQSITRHNNDKEISPNKIHWHNNIGVTLCAKWGLLVCTETRGKTLRFPRHICSNSSKYSASFVMVISADSPYPPLIIIPQAGWNADAALSIVLGIVDALVHVSSEGFYTQHSSRGE